MEVVEVEEVAIAGVALTTYNRRGGFICRGRGRGSYSINVGNQGNQTTGIQNQIQTTSNGNANQPPGQNNQKQKRSILFPLLKQMVQISIIGHFNALSEIKF